MNTRFSSLVPGLALASLLSLAPLSAPAQNAPMMKGEGMGGAPMMGGEGMQGDHMQGGMEHMQHMMGGEGMPGGMEHMQGGRERMQHMMAMMHERLAHANARIEALKKELKISEAQTPVWDKFAEALRSATTSMEQSMEGMEAKMESGAMLSLPESIEHHIKMATEHLANLQAIKSALDPLYATFSDEQKKLADHTPIGPMGLM
ncbi:MAG TPA: Spy/CpxP family protein refolding chaperone [Methylocella sp.]|nr:Spy/CpxP family protein refolding chaperone [Methylocella sp.]